MFQKLEAFTKKVSDLADKPYMNPDELKAYFDAAPEEVRNALNSLIDALQSTTDDSGAKNIGVSPIEGIAGANVQELLISLKADLDAAITGQIPDRSIAPIKLSFDAETVTGAQTKANTAETNAKKYADDNFDTSSEVTDKVNGVTTKKINVINLINSTSSLASYPEGLSLFAGTETAGYSHFSTVFTLKVDNDRGVQYAFDRINATMKMRYWTGVAWSAWDPDNRLWLEVNRLNEVSFNAQTMTRVTFDVAPKGRQTSAWANNKFTAPRKGVYLFNIAASVKDLGQYGVLELYLFKNGSQYKRLDKVVAPGTTSMTAQGNISLELNTGESIEFYVYSNESDVINENTYVTIAQLA